MHIIPTAMAKHIVYKINNTCLILNCLGMHAQLAYLFCFILLQELIKFEYVSIFTLKYSRL